MFSLTRKPCPILASRLFSEKSFYPTFVTDMREASTSIVIESPFISQRRLDRLCPVLDKALRRGVRIVVNTRSPAEHDGLLRMQSEEGVNTLQNMGILVLLTGGHHRKLAIIDDKILYEGSLNILSQNDSCEVMRRIESVDLARQMIEFTGLERWYTK